TSTLRLPLPAFLEALHEPQTPAIDELAAPLCAVLIDHRDSSERIDASIHSEEGLRDDARRLILEGDVHLVPVLGLHELCRLRAPASQELLDLVVATELQREQRPRGACELHHFARANVDEPVDDDRRGEAARARMQVQENEAVARLRVQEKKKAVASSVLYEEQGAKPPCLLLAREIVACCVLRLERGRRGKARKSRG